jgi:hypothetical protein
MVMDLDILRIDHDDHSWLPFYLTMWLHNIGGSHSDSYHVVVEVLGFGTMCICRSMLMFLRNMLSPSSWAEMTRQGYRGVYIGPEEQGLRAGSQSEGWNMETACRPIGSLQEGHFSP